MSAADDMIEGIGNEIISTILIIFFGLVLLVLVFIYERLTAPPEQRRIPRLFNTSNACPICLGPHTLAVETNCGHLYCGTCLNNMYEVNNSRALNCPICRTRISLLFLHITQEEIAAPRDSELGRDRTIVNDFHRHYNDFHSSMNRCVSSVHAAIQRLAIISFETPTEE